MAKQQSTGADIRLDKWLWAARFFKTRNIAKSEIEGGKVKLNGARTKPSKIISVGDQVSLRQGWDDKEVIVEGLSAHRQSFQVAQSLYRETEASIQLRERLADERKAANAGVSHQDVKPNKKQRRLIHKFKQMD